MNLDEKYLRLIKKILDQHNYSFYLFGSRMNKTAKKYSDVDIFFKDNIPENELSAIEGKFEESDLPYQVDLVDYNKCNAEFQKIISKNCYKL